MNDILKRLDFMFIRFAAESNDDAAIRRVQAAKDAAEEIKKLRNENDKLKEALRRVGKGNVCETTLSYPPICYRALTARLALEEKETTND